MQSWLRANTEYDLEVPRDPDGVDAVDHFLFETRRGYCEQIATSMAVMLRTLGIPTRLVTGYGPGERNPLTGYFEVKQSDAHAWLEVYYPGIGWVPYDPTFGVPEAAPGVASRFMAGPVFAAIAPRRRRRRARAGEGGGRLGRARGGGRRCTRGAGMAGRPGALFAIGLGVASLRRARRRRRDPASTPAEAAFLELTTALEPAGHLRAPQTTPSEFLDELIGDEALAREVVQAAEVVVRTFERERFAPVGPDDEPRSSVPATASSRVRTLVGRR